RWGGSARSKRSARPPCSWRPTRRPTSPGRRSWSTAARRCPSHWPRCRRCEVEGVSDPVPGLPPGLAALGPSAAKLRDRLIAEIAEGNPGPGERLGAERELAVRYGVSRSTLRAALDSLETAGVVRRVRGRSGGIFVSERRVERDLTSLTGLPAYL